MPPVIPLLVAGGAAAAGTAGTAGAIGGVAGLIGVTSVTTAAIVNAGVGTALVLGASYAMAKLSPAPRQPRPADGTIEYKAPLAPRFFPYGKCKVSGPILFLELGGGGGGRLLKIVAFGSRELGVMDPLFVDGTAVTLSPGVGGSDGFYANWSEGGTARGGVWTHLGKDSQAADAQLLSDYPSGWTSAHRLRGIPYAYAQFESAPANQFQEAFPGGEPNFAVVGGVKLYDPRKDSTMPAGPGYPAGVGAHRQNDPTTWEFSDNQRLACLDWITWKDGYNKDWSRIDWSSWVPQIAMADDAIALKAGGTEPRYRIATIVSMAEPKGRVLRRIMDAGDQQLFTTNAGLIGTRGGVWQTPSASLSAAEILEGQFTHGVGVMDRINEFQLTAMLPSHDYAEVELAPWSNTGDPEFIDGILRSQPLDLTQVPSNSQAQRLAKIRMAKVNPRWSGSVRTNFAGLDALGEAAVNLSFDELDQPDGSFDGPFLINGKIGFLPDKTGMTVSLSSIDPACYDWNAGEEQYAPPSPDDPYATVAPVASGSLTVGSVLSCTTGTWTMSPTGYTYQWLRGSTLISGATSSTYTTVTADAGKLLRCAVTATNAAGKVGHADSNTLSITPAIPVNTVLPVISGTTEVGQTLTTTTGTWTFSPTSYAYQWKKGGVAIGGATSSSYLLVSGDVGGTITVTVTATNSSGSGNATSAGVGPVVVPLIGGEKPLGADDGLGVDFKYATDSNRVAVKTSGVAVFSGLDTFFQNGGTSPKMVFDVAGNLVSTPHNMCLQSQAFDNTTPWNPTTAVTVTANAIAAPDGTMTADRLVETSISSTHGIIHANINVVSGETYTFSVYAKAGERNWLSIAPSNTTPADWFDLTAGTVGTTANGATIVSVGSGWYRCSITQVSPGTTRGPTFFIRTANGQTAGYVGDVTKGLYLWGAQLNRGSTPAPYMPTTTVARAGLAVDYDPITHAAKGLLAEAAATNLLLNSSTQSVSTSATPYTLSFFGTGTVTLSGSSTAGPLVGTGVNNRVSLTFTPTAGTLTLTVSGTVTRAQLENNAFASSYIPTFGAAAARGADNYTCLLSTIPTLGSAWSLYVRFSTPAIANGKYAVAVTEGVGNELVGVQSATTAKLFVVDGGSAVGQIVGPTLVANTPVSAAARIKLNDCALSVGGGAVGTDTTVTLPTPTEVRFGNVGSNAAATASFYIETLAIITGRGLSDAELVTKSAT